MIQVVDEDFGALLEHNIGHAIWPRRFVWAEFADNAGDLLLCELGLVGYEFGVSVVGWDGGGCWRRWEEGVRYGLHFVLVRPCRDVFLILALGMECRDPGCGPAFSCCGAVNVPSSSPQSTIARLFEEVLPVTLFCFADSIREFVACSTVYGTGAVGRSATCTICC